MSLNSTFPSGHVKHWWRYASLLRWGRNSLWETINCRLMSETLRQWLPHPCLTGLKIPPCRGELVIHSTEIPMPSPTVPRAVHFSTISGFQSEKKKKKALHLIFSVIFCPYRISRRWGMWDSCNCHAGHEEDKPTGSAPRQPDIAPLHFLSLQIPRLHACHLRQQVGTSANVFVSKHRSDWNVIVQPLWLVSLFCSACSWMWFVTHSLDIIFYIDLACQPHIDPTLRSCHL